MGVRISAQVEDWLLSYCNNEADRREQLIMWLVNNAIIHYIRIASREI